MEPDRPLDPHAPAAPAEEAEAPPPAEEAEAPPTAEEAEAAARLAAALDSGYAAAGAAPPAAEFATAAFLRAAAGPSGPTPAALDAVRRRAFAAYDGRLGPGRRAGSLWRRLVPLGIAAAALATALALVLVRDLPPGEPTALPAPGVPLVAAHAAWAGRQPGAEAAFSCEYGAYRHAVHAALRARYVKEAGR